MVELDGQLQLELEPRSAWREQVEQSLFEQSHIYNIGAQQSEMHQDMYQDIPFVDTFRIPNAQGEEKDQESIASDPQKDDPWKHKVEESLWQLHQKWMELSTILQEEYRRIDASIILPNIDEDLHHHTGLESEVVVVAVEEEPSAQAPPNDDIPFEDMLESSSSIAKDNMEPVLVHDDEARFLHHFLFSWLALSILRDQHDAPKTRIPRMVRRKVTKTRSLPRRTLLSDLEDWDLNDDEFDLLLMDLKLPSMVEEEYSVYEYDAMEEMGDDLELSLPLDILEQETYTPVTDDDEETNAFLKASSAPESWHVVFGELEENEFDSCCDDDPETNVAADYHGESSDDDWANPDEVAQVVLSRDADHQNSPIDTESSMYIGTARRRPPPPPLEDEDDDFFNDLEKQLLEETGAHIEIELDGGRPEYEDEDDMDEEDWRVLQTSATSDGFEDSFALFGEDEDLDRFNVDDEWTEVDPFDEESIAIVPVEEEEEMSLGESASTHPPLPVLQTNFGYPPSLVPPPPSWVAPHSLRTDKLNPEEMRQAPFMRMPQSRNTSYNLYKGRRRRQVFYRRHLQRAGSHHRRRYFLLRLVRLSLLEFRRHHQNSGVKPLVLLCRSKVKLRCCTHFAAPV
jgi:hypothetical protein